MPANTALTRSRFRRPAHAPRAGVSHEILLYCGVDGFLEGTLEPVKESLALGARVLVAVCDERANALAQALGADAEHVRFVAVREYARNPARAFPLFQAFAREASVAGDEAALGISELVWPERTAAELSECERHEALLNLALGGGPRWRLLCAYDEDTLAPEVLAAANRAHPLLAKGCASRVNPAYAGGGDEAQPLASTLPEPPGAPTSVVFASETLGQLRHSLSAWAQANGLDGEGSEELVLAVNELAANSVRHGGGGGTVRHWREHGAIVCEVRDAGHIQDPLAGHARPTPDACSGRGLWLVNQLCDLVQIRSAPTGSVVRVRKRLP